MLRRDRILWGLITIDCGMKLIAASALTPKAKVRGGSEKRFLHLSGELVGRGYGIPILISISLMSLKCKEAPESPIRKKRASI